MPENNSCYSLEKEFLNYLEINRILSPQEINLIRQEIDRRQENLEILLKDYLTQDEILEHKSSLLGLPRVSLKGKKSIDRTVAALVPEELARKYFLVPIALDKDILQVAMSDPTNLQALDELSLYTGLTIEPFLMGLEEIKVAIREYYTVGSSPEGEINPVLSPLWKVEEEGETGPEGPVVRLVDSLFSQAVREGASDIHWEPAEKDFVVKFRIDGLLEVKATLPAWIARSTAARLKVMAGMDVTERRIPQDGRIVLDFPGKRIDIRVSTLATVYGEKVVTRILDSDTAGRSLKELGMREQVEEEIRKLLRHPHGLILISGPTGSGKTTTLYALLKELYSETLNIVSIEDPVEYRLAGVNQAQVNPRVGLDFANGLRAILRQDPDIIMIGEIRDKDTARIATAAALTGHLVLSTVHTNTAAEALARLLDMDIEPYLLASAVCGIIAQRLVRRLCPACSKEQEMPYKTQEMLGWYPKGKIYGPQGCLKCRGTGYSGRIGIHEYLPYTEEIKSLVIKKSNALDIEQTARSLGMLSLLEDALLKVERGLTSLEEVLRQVYCKL